ncbi:hypothetical protein ACEPAG_1225 [Sanghuangporus baumii]
MSVRPAPARSLDLFNLLNFPSNSKGLSEYKSRLQISTADAANQQQSPRSRSPPRKTARLEGDSDYASSVKRSSDKGKGKQRADATDALDDGVKRLTVTNPPDNTRPDSYFNSLLRTIQNAIHSVLLPPQRSSSTVSKSRSFIHEDIFNATRMIVVIAGKGQWVYDKMQFEIREATSSVNKSLLSHKDLKSEDWLEELVNATVWFDKCIRLMETLLTYLDLVFVPNKADTLHVRELGMQIYRTQILQYDRIRSCIQDAIKGWVKFERHEKQKHPGRQTIVTLVRLLAEYSLFNELFLEPYIEATRRFYSDESERLAETLKDDQNGFLRHCADRLQEEERRSSEVLSGFEGDWTEIQKTTERALLDSRLHWLSLGIKSAVDTKSMDGLVRMYSLFSRVDGLGVLCGAFKDHVHKVVLTLVNDKERDEEMVDRLLDFKAFIDTALVEAFVGDRQFKNAATDAFATGFRVRKIVPAEKIAKYLDRDMRRGQKGASDEEFQKKLEAVLGLYRFTRDKDVFRTFYHKALAKRLLLQRSASDDFEKSVLKILKEQYDPEFSMGDNMFRDLALSRDLMTEFQEREARSGEDKSDQPSALLRGLNVMVLEAAFWPFSTKRTGEAVLPVLMAAALARFEGYYKSKHKGRKLNWDHSLGTAALRARFKAGEKELTVSMYQTLVLLLFNDQDEIVFTDIKEQTQIEDGDLRRTLQSLACGAKKVLKKRPQGKDVGDSDVFVFNAEFTDERFRVHINSIQVKETPEETKRTQGAIEMERKSLLDAAIVRIMKAKKTMTHQALINETVDVMKKHFQPDVGMIKTRFEQLIEQEYMRRDDNEPNKYVYVA